MNYFQISSQAPTITDWIQTGVYILTAAGLLANFWYQRKSLQEQNHLRFIEEERDRRAIMPYVEFMGAFDSDEHIFRLTFTCRQHDGKFLMISPLADELKAYFIVGPDFKKDQEFLMSIPQKQMEGLNQYHQSGAAIFNIDYMDRDSRPYVQQLHLTGFQMYLSDPIEYRYVKMMNDRQKRRGFWPFRRKKKIAR